MTGLTFISYIRHHQLNCTRTGAVGITHHTQYKLHKSRRWSNSSNIKKIGLCVFLLFRLPTLKRAMLRFLQPKKEGFPTADCLAMSQFFYMLPKSLSHSIPPICTRSIGITNKEKSQKTRDKKEFKIGTPFISMCGGCASKKK